MEIAGRKIANGTPPYLIAEISCNHGGSVRNALRLMDEAKAAGADAVKFQAYTPDTITLDHDGPGFILEDGPWAGWRLYDLYSETHTPFEWFPVLFQHARDIGITAFASVFDRTSVDMLEKLGCPAYKIASFEIVDTPLIRYAAKTGKPLILSTGMATVMEVYEARAAANGNTAVLHCVSGYPTKPEEANLGTLRKMISFARNSSVVGISDHSIGDEIAIGATTLGAAIIEKHFRLDDINWTADAKFSMRPEAFREMARSVRRTHLAMQTVTPQSEVSSRPLRRSLYAVADIKAGELLTESNVRSIRPGYGLPPKMLPDILGRCARRDIRRGTPLSIELIGQEVAA